MASESRSSSHHQQTERQKGRSVFELPIEFFDSCRLLSDGSSSTSQYGFSENSSTNAFVDEENPRQEVEDKIGKISLKWSCNTCNDEFDSLLDQRSHFKSDFHRLNIKLSVAGKNTIKEEDFDVLDQDSLFKDDDLSSISGSEDETEKASFLNYESYKRAGESVKRKLFFRLHTGEIVSVWKCLLMNESEDLSVDNDKVFAEENVGGTRFLKENEIVERLKRFTHEPRDKTQLRIVLLASGGHFAGCVFDGNSVVAHKTFHRYVVRAKAGKKQSTKDATGKAANSAGSNLRRYNELALKKEIQELLAAWKPYFELSCCTYINSPSNNRQLLFSGDKSYFSDPHRIVRCVPFIVRRPTCKEVKRVYDRLTSTVYEVNEPEKGSSQSPTEDKTLYTDNIVKGNLEEPQEEKLEEHLGGKEIAEACQEIESSEELSISNKNEVLGVSTPLHEAATSSNAQQTLDLLEQGSDPCAKDERGRTPYMLATDKEVRNMFRRFMALNLDKWDWNAAKVPSPLTKEMEESQAAKQAEKDAKRKAKAKELKKLRKAKEKAQAEAALAKNTPKVPQGQGPVSTLKSRPTPLSKEEELKKAQAAEREKRAAAAEKRMAAATAAAPATTSNTGAASAAGTSNTGATNNGITCSCCSVSLEGIVPFHRYNYKYCSTSCMHVHREILEDG